MEDPISITRKTHPHQFSFRFSSHLCNVSFSYTSECCEEAGQIQKEFPWHGCKENKGYNLVKWVTVLHRKDKGGLGIRDLRKHNNSLLMKWLWRYTEERQALWKNLIKCKYGEDGFWCSNISTDA